MTDYKRVVVTGIGVESPLGRDLETVQSALFEGTSATEFSQDFSDHKFDSNVHAVVHGFEGAGAFDRKAVRHMGKGRMLPMGYSAALKAAADCGIDTDTLSEDTMIGMLLGTGGPATEDQVAATIALLENMELPEEKQQRLRKVIGLFQVTPCMSSCLQAVCSTLLKNKGIGFGVTSACATSAHAIGEAWWMIRTGRQRVMFAGGAEDCHPTKAQGFDAMGAMVSAFNDTPESASRAFSKDAAGFVDAEGAGVLVLEELESALRRGAHIYAEIVGYGATSDGHDPVAPSGEGAVRCMKEAISTATLPVGYINPHGTSTPIGDPKELWAIKEVFGADVPPIASTKSLTGHALGAAGVLEAIYSIIMMNNSFVCASAHITEVIEEGRGLPIPLNRLDTVELRAVLSNSFGFGGTNACLVLANPQFSL